MDLAKRLLALMQLGANLQGADGHIWLMEGDTGETGTLDDIFRKNGIVFNSKIYGGILEALDTIDAALLLCGEKPLLERYNEDIQFLGNGGVSQSRIDIVAKSRGGIN